MTDLADIENHILADRKRVADIYVNAAQDNLAKGWHSGDAIAKALFFSASHPDYKQINQQIRLGRLKNIIQSCCEYEWKLTQQFMILSRTALQMFNEEKNLGDLNLTHFEKNVKEIQSDLSEAEKNVEQNAQQYSNQLKGLLNKES